MSTPPTTRAGPWANSFTHLLARLTRQDSVASDFRDNLSELQNASLLSMALFTGALGYVWIALTIWPVSWAVRSGSTWLGALTLIVSASLALFIKARHLYLAGHGVIWGAVIALACAMLVYPVSRVAYLFIVPIIFANVVHRRWTVFLLALAASTITLLIRTQRPEPAESGAEVVAPLLIIGLTAIASWLTTQNLYIALSWVWSAYERPSQRRTGPRSTGGVGARAESAR